jgi:endo-1,4-beta-xylanase
MVLYALVVGAVVGPGLLLTAASNKGSDGQPALKDVFAGDFLVGVALNRDQILGNRPDENRIIVRQFSSITPENVLKWQKVHPEPDRYAFSASDQFVIFGREHEMFVVGHTLIWHHQTPQWVFQDADGNDTDRQTLLRRMKDHISNVVGRYKGWVNGWDVVNEAVREDGNLRNTKWLEIIGPDYIAKAFEYAHQADPCAELYYNDFNMWKAGQRQGVIRLVKDLQAKGIRIDGIGMQGHWGLDSDYPPLDELEASIVAFAELGVKVMITEMDVTVLPLPDDYRGADIARRDQLQEELNPYPDGLPAEMQQKLAQRYAALFALFHKHADKISRVTFWGVQDGDSWRNNWPVRGRTDYPLLFDRDCKAKPAFDAVIKVTQHDK